MNKRLARLADIAYRRRGRVVVAWIVAMVVLIGLGSSLAGEYNADYDTPGSESKAASDLPQSEFGGYSGQEVYLVWQAEVGALSPAVKQHIDDFLARATKVEDMEEPTPPRIAQDGTI